MRKHTVRQLATLAGVSVRTLHHNDQIGLLRPAERTEAGYRLYGEGDLLRLQQILLYKELDFPLDDIQRMLDRPGFDLVDALGSHRRNIEQRIERLERLLTTIDKTMEGLKGERMALTDAELYEGLTKEQAERYEREARATYDPERVAESYRRIRKMTPAQWKDVKAEGQAISVAMAGLMDKQPGDPEVQKAVARHHAWIECFYSAPANVYGGLGKHYAEHPEFRANYEKVAVGLADFMNAAIAYYCEHSL
jgi:DNA-binding transcriptional MerR regulator